MGQGNIFTGRSGEAAAIEYLKKRKYKIVEVNFRTPFGEIDIIAERKKTIVFVEVKTRRTDSLGPPYLSVTRQKQFHIVKNALFYLKRHNLGQADWRIDIVSVKMNPLSYVIDDIEIIENAVDDINI